MMGYLGSVSALLRNGKLLLVLIFAAGFAGGQSTILTFLPIYLDEDLGASSVTIGLYLSLAQVGGIVSQPLIGFASDRLGRKLILAPSLAMLGLSFVGLSIVPSGWLFGLVVLAMGAFLFPLMSILLASAMDLVEVGAQATTVSLVFGSAVVVSGCSGIACVALLALGTIRTVLPCIPLGPCCSIRAVAAAVSYPTISTSIPVISLRSLIPIHPICPIHPIRPIRPIITGKTIRTLGPICTVSAVLPVTPILTGLAR